MRGPVMEFVIDIFLMTFFKRRAFLLVADILIIAFSMYASFWIRFEGIIPDKLLSNLKYYIPLARAVKLGFLMYYDLYGIPWRFFSITERVYPYL
jgi:FlaA1/EpsC-like NDP-sugar epimerase